MQAREPPSTCVQPRRVLPDGDGVVAMQPGETGFSLADPQTLFSLMAASSIALIPSRAPLLPALWGQTGGVWPPAALVPPPPEIRRCTLTPAWLVPQAIITHPARLFVPHPSTHHPLHSIFLVSALHSYPSSSISPPATRSCIHPSASPSHSIDLSTRSTFMHH